MRRLMLCLLPLVLLLSGCNSGYDFMETKSIPKARFHDTKPQDFGPDHPQLRPIHGIDISKWQGGIDWETGKASGVAFAFIKATESKDIVDNKFEEYSRQTRAAGIPSAPYHFYYFCSTPDEQAD